MDNLFWQTTKIKKKQRFESNKQKPCIIWFTGLSASGKTTIADLLEKKLFEKNKKTYLLDGDNIRHGLSADLSFSDEDRFENIRRVSEVSKLMVDAGLIVISAFISPFQAERKMAREIFEKEEFVEVFVDTPIEICEKRDTKGLYKKAKEGLVKNFTGISSKYEIPKNPEIILKAGEKNPEDCSEQIIEFLQRNNKI
ncbi:MAG: adenylyl-sulfate kinase [Pelagibacteraceae bacterium TMED287]|nr:MAG: adenylyl-sulfate kinase [Pelagibacteraceae bacterium TMED287]